MKSVTMKYEKDPLFSAGDVVVTIEGIEFEDVIDPLAFLDSLHQSGEYWIVTCTCGEPNCAGIWEPVTVTVNNEEDAVTWRFNTKFYQYIGTLPVDEQGYATLTFSRQQTIKSVIASITNMRADKTTSKVSGLPFEHSKDQFYEHPLVYNLMFTYPNEDELIGLGIRAGADDEPYTETP